MNYIRHLTSAMDQIMLENDFNPSHVSLYLALFHLWNVQRFTTRLSINRSEVMQVSKIGSKTTYHRCLRDLDKAGFLKYFPSHNPLRGSIIEMAIFGTTVEPTIKEVNKQPVISLLNEKKENKTYKQEVSQKSKNEKFIPPSINDLIPFFVKLNSNEYEAERFFNHYESNGWLVGGKSKMKDWNAASRNWILNALKFQKSTPSTHVNNQLNKLYDQPL